MTRPWRERESKSLTGANPRAPQPESAPRPPRAHISIPKDVPLRSRAYTDFIRSRPCHHCAAREGVQAAHFAPRGDGGGMATKADDRRTVPQCETCHGYWHQHGVLPSTPMHWSANGSHTREHSEYLMLREQVRCLIAWDTLQRGEGTL